MNPEIHDNAVVVYGASDDLIEIDGAITEEFSMPDTEEALLAFSNGVLLRVEYRTVWRIIPVAGLDKVTITQATEDDESNYSDRAVIAGPVKWVALASSYAK